MTRRSTLFFFLAIGLAFGELPPSAYEKMQSEAPEVLRIQVLRVDVQSAGKPEVSDVTMLAEVLKVGRSRSKVKPADMITVKYQVTAREPHWVGPGEVPILKDNAQTVAYLSATGNEKEYTPAAGAMSFDRF